MDGKKFTIEQDDTIVVFGKAGTARTESPLSRDSTEGSKIPDIAGDWSIISAAAEGDSAEAEEIEEFFGEPAYTFYKDGSVILHRGGEEIEGTYRAEKDVIMISIHGRELTAVLNGDTFRIEDGNTEVVFERQ